MKKSSYNSQRYNIYKFASNDALAKAKDYLEDAKEGRNIAEQYMKQSQNSLKLFTQAFGLKDLMLPQMEVEGDAI